MNHMEMDSDFIAMLPQWPVDTRDCIFLGRALEQLENTSTSPEDARNRMVDAIERGELSLRCRLVFEKEARFGHVNSGARTPEGWGECLMYFCIVERDTRPWVPAARRRPIPQPWWLFVTRESWTEYLGEKSAIIGTALDEKEAFPVLVALLRKHRNKLSKKDGFAACRKERPTLSERGFKRIWPEARREARLQPRAPAGPKGGE